MRPVGNIFTDPAQRRFMQDLADAINRASITKAEKPGYFLAVEKLTSGMPAGGSFPGWQVRSLNTVSANEGGYCSLSGSTVTLQPGTYEFFISAPAYQVGRHRVEVRNSRGSERWPGTVESSDPDAPSVTRSVVSGRIKAEKKMSIMVYHWTEKEVAGNGLGVAGDFGDEIYTMAEFRRIGG